MELSTKKQIFGKLYLVFKGVLSSSNAIWLGGAFTTSTVNCDASVHVLILSKQMCKFCIFVLQHFWKYLEIPSESS